MPIEYLKKPGTGGGAGEICLQAGTWRNSRVVALRCWLSLILSSGTWDMGWGAVTPKHVLAMA